MMRRSNHLAASHPPTSTSTKAAASHTVEIMFNLPADFEGDGVASVPGIMVK
jgi:hypothetical protein